MLLYGTKVAIITGGGVNQGYRPASRMVEQNNWLGTITT
jgi:hypothetical protein